MDDLSDSNLDNSNSYMNEDDQKDKSSGPYLGVFTGGRLEDNPNSSNHSHNSGRLRTRHRNLYDSNAHYANFYDKIKYKSTKNQDNKSSNRSHPSNNQPSPLFPSLNFFNLNSSLSFGGGYQSSDGQEIIDNNALKQKRTKKKRKTIVSRRFERDQKRNFSDLSDHPPDTSPGAATSGQNQSRDQPDSPLAAAAVAQSQLLLPSPGHFRSLRANPKTITIREEMGTEDFGQEQDVEDGINSDENSPLSSYNKILAERMEFYNNFSILVQLGDKAMKFQDSQQPYYYHSPGSQNLSQNTNTSSSMTPKPTLARLARRTSWSSSGGGSTFSQQQRSKVLFGDWLWLHLQAWQAGKSLKFLTIYESLSEIDNELIEKRAQNMQILDEIKCFTFKFDNSNGRGLTNTTNVAIESQCPIDLIDNLSNYIRLQKRALCDVQSLFDRFDQLLALFPNYKAFLSHASNEYTPELDEKLTVLQIWSNLTRDLSRKMKIIGHILEMHKARGVVDWPNLDYESPNQSRASSSSSAFSLTPDSAPRPLSTNRKKASVTEIDQSKSKNRKIGPETHVIELTDPKTISDLTKLRMNVKKLTPKNSQKSKSRDQETFIFDQSETELSENEVSLGDAESDQNRRFSGIFSDIFVTCPASVYKLFVERSLKLRGMRKVLFRVGAILTPILFRARLALQKRRQNPPPGGLRFMNSAMTGAQGSKNDKKDKDEEDLTKFGANNAIFKSTKLPTFYYSYLFVLKIPLNLTHEWLKIRIDQKSARSPDPLTLDQLILDCRDCLAAASEVKSFYQDHVQSCTIDQKLLEKLLIIDMQDFENDLFTMFDIYLDYVRQWSSHQTNLHKISTEWSQTLINRLEEEWKFAKMIAINILSGESDAARRFCCINNEMYQSIEDLLEDLKDNLNNIFLNDEPDKQLQIQNQHQHQSKQRKSTSSSNTTRKTASTSGSSRVSRKNSTRKSIRSIFDEEKIEDEYANEAGDNEEEDEDEEYDDEEEEAVEESCLLSPKSDETLNIFRLDSKKSSRIFKSCRLIRHYLHEIREKSLRALTFSKFIRRDLEISTRYELKCDHNSLLAKLFETNHYLLKTVTFSPDFLIFCKDNIAQDEEFLQLLLNVTCGRDEREIPPRIAKLKGYLLLINCGKDKCEKLSQKWMGNVKTVTPNADTNLALHHLNVDGVYLVVTSSARLREQRNNLKELIGPDFLNVIDEQCSCHGMIGEFVQDLKNCAMKLRSKLILWLKLIESEYSNCKILSNFDENEKQTYRDTLIQVYNFIFEYHKELCKIVSGKLKSDLMDGARQFAQQWAKFVVQICERGHGARPRWANDGLNFLVFASEPTYTIPLTESQFADLKKLINDCIDHIIGSKPKPISTGTQTGSTTSGVTGSSIESVHRAVSWPQTKNLPMEATFASGSKSGPKHSLTVPNQINQSTSLNLHNDQAEPISPSTVTMATRSDTIILDKKSRVLSEINRLESNRESKLKLEKRIGRLVERKFIKPHSQIALKRANFRWQRLNNKIGSGKFGSVYTAINLDSGKLMAVKQIKFQHQDHQAMQSLVDEVTNFEGIKHENLVRYYGVEVHRDELFIFMEYCSEGTLEALCIEGLSEDLVRMYALHLLTAVCELHRRSIVHRDIKTANIFLSNVSNERYVLKLGDFGSSVRLKDTTTAMGELTSYVGTPAYMAPEVCTSSQEGYGRTADIWSLGCVVLEMATGKPPWHDLTNTYAIVWKVGNGAIPLIPDTLSPDCKDFLLRCFKFKSSSRSTAEQLLEHPFVKVHN